MNHLVGAKCTHKNYHFSVPQLIIWQNLEDLSHTRRTDQRSLLFCNAKSEYILLWSDMPRGMGFWFAFLLGMEKGWSWEHLWPSSSPSTASSPCSSWCCGLAADFEALSQVRGWGILGPEGERWGGSLKYSEFCQISIPFFINENNQRDKISTHMRVNQNKTKVRKTRRRRQCYFSGLMC